MSLIDSFKRAGSGLVPASLDLIETNLFQAVDDECAVVARHALVDAAESGRVVVRRHAAEAGNHGDILLAVDGVADDTALVAGAVGVVPQLGAGFGIIGVEDAA